MAKPTTIPFYLLFIVSALTSADSSRILDQVAPQPVDLVNPPATLGPLVSPSPQPPLVMGLTAMITPNGPGPQPQVVVGPSSDPTLSFFMHDILGGSHPSARVVTGITAKSETDTTGLPFSKPNNNIFPLPGGVPLISTNNHVSGLNNRNFNGRNKNNQQPFVTAGQLPSGATLQDLLFGSVTTIDDELTEAEELGSAVIGRAQGFYFASSLDGSSHTIAFTVMLNEHSQEDDDGDHHRGRKVQDTISFFGVHRRVSPESRIAVVGGTGKYEEAGGFAVIESLRRRENQHMTDGSDSIVHFSVYLSK